MNALGWFYVGVLVILLSGAVLVWNYFGMRRDYYRLHERWADLAEDNDGLREEMYFLRTKNVRLRQELREQKRLVKVWEENARRLTRELDQVRQFTEKNTDDGGW